MNIQAQDLHALVLAHIRFAGGRELARRTGSHGQLKLYTC
jgi:hypothetical protein